MSDAKDWGRRFVRSLRDQGIRVRKTKGWGRRGQPWPDGEPRAVMWHWTAGAATDSTDPRHPGNRPGANDGVISWVEHPSSDWPYANISLDRDGTVVIHSVLRCWHAGPGTFRGTPFASLGIPDNDAARFTLGVEVVDKGLKRGTFTAAQWRSIDAINVAARKASGWGGFQRRVLDHQTWAPWRKSDIGSLYDMDRVRERAHRAWKARRDQAPD